MKLAQVFSERMIYLAAIAVASMITVGIFFFQVYAQPLSAQFKGDEVASVAPGDVYLSAEEAARVSAIREAEPAPILEVHIANNGLVLLRGARVISISNTELRVNMAWGPSNFTWTVKTDYHTRYVTSKGEKGVSTDIQIGDIITVTGMLIENNGEPILNAQFLRST